MNHALVPSIFEPCLAVARALLPSMTTLSVLDGQAAPLYSSEMVVDGDLSRLAGEALRHAELAPHSPGEAATLRPGESVYFFWLRRDDASPDAPPFAVLAIGCRHARDTEPKSFRFVHGLLAAATECLRRELLAREEITRLNAALLEHGRDLDMLLAMSSDADGAEGNEGDLQAMLRGAAAHLDAGLVVLIVPEKGLSLVQLGQEKPFANAQLARAHRHLLSMSRQSREAVIINQLRLDPAEHSPVCRVAACAVGRPDGRSMGVLALFRSLTAAEFDGRHGRLVQLLARRAAAIIASSYDPLTGLLTRLAFEQRVRRTLAAGGREWCALYVDTNRMHVINDNFGMHVGDQVLRELGELVRQLLPPGALAARISGDRFAILLPAMLEDAARLAESLRERATKAAAGIGDGSLPVSVSIGVAGVDERAREFAHAFAAAETVCKAANDRGRNRVEIYQETDQSIVRRFADVNLLGNLRGALDHDQLRLHVQAITPLDPRHAAPHFEILLRMQSETGETLGPDHFMSAAQRYQMMPEIDRWVMSKTIEQLRPWAALLADAGVVFTINCSGQSLRDSGFADYVIDLVQESGINPRALTFELTESAAVGNLAQAEEFMRGLQRLGCGIALDDFGTGFSSLAYLRELPITMLKIDGSFVRDVLKDSRAASMIEVIARLAHSMSMTTVAEYIETEEIRARITELGVDYGQGFAIARPVPLEEVLAQLPSYVAASRCSGSWTPPATAAV